MTEKEIKKHMFPNVEQLEENNFNIQIDGIDAICIIAAIQLATRHPKFIGPSRHRAEKFARQLQAEVSERLPAASVVIEMGWNQDYDIT